MLQIRKPQTTNWFFGATLEDFKQRFIIPGQIFYQEKRKQV